MAVVADALAVVVLLFGVVAGLDTGCRWNHGRTVTLVESRRGRSSEVQKEKEKENEEKEGDGR